MKTKDEFWMRKEDENRAGSMSRRRFMKNCTGALFAVSTLGFPRLLLGKEPAKIPVGIVVPLSGPMTGFGVRCRRGYELGVEEINSKGGIRSLGGAKIEAIFRDSEGKTGVAVGEAERLINDGVKVLISNAPSSTALVISQVAERRKVPNIIPNSSADAIREQNFKWSFMIYQSTTIDGRLFYEALADLEKTTGVKIKTAAFLYNNGVWGQGRYKGIKKFHNKIMPNLEVVAEVSYPPKTPDLSSELSLIKARKPDILCPTSYISDAILMTKNMYALRFDVQGIVGPSLGHLVPDYGTALGKLAEFTMGVSSVMDNRNKYVKMMKADAKKTLKIDSIDIGETLSFDSIMVLRNALETAGSLDNESVREGLKRSRTPSTLAQDDIVFGEDGQNINVGAGIAQWLNSKLQVVFPRKFAGAEVVFPVPAWSERKV